MMPKVLIHTPDLSTPGGKQSFFLAVQPYLPDEVFFFIYGAKGKKESKFKQLLRLISDYWRFGKALREKEIDIVHLNPSLNPKSFFRDWLFALITKFYNVKLLVFWHGWNWEFENRVVSRLVWFFNWTFGKADYMVVLAKEFKDRLREYGFQKPVEIGKTVINDIIMEGMNEQLISNRDFVNSELRLLFLSRVTKPKGIYEVLDSFLILKRKYPDLRLEVAGTGSELDQVKSYVLENKLLDVNFLGWVSGESKAQAFRNAHIYILASYTEGLPCSLLEAMGSGLAVVATDVGGIKDMFQNGKMGFLVKARDVESLTQNIFQLIEDRRLLKEISFYNYQYALTHFTSTSVAECLINTYEKVYEPDVVRQSFSEKVNTKIP